MFVTFVLNVVYLVNKSLNHKKSFRRNIVIVVDLLCRLSVFNVLNLPKLPAASIVYLKVKFVEHLALNNFRPSLPVEG